jgi:hypothetical protein
MDKELTRETTRAMRRLRHKLTRIKKSGDYERYERLEARWGHLNAEFRRLAK